MDKFVQSYKVDDENKYLNINNSNFALANKRYCKNICYFNIME